MECRISKLLCNGLFSIVLLFFLRPALYAIEPSTEKEGQKIILVLNLQGKTKYAEAILYLPVEIAYGGIVGKGWALSVDEFNKETSQTIKYEGENRCKLTGAAGLKSTSAKKDKPTLPFVQIYRKSEKQLTLYFKIGYGTLDIYWVEQGKVANEVKIQLSEKWLKYGREIGPTPEHPNGGLKIEVPEAVIKEEKEWLEFFLDFQADPDFGRIAESPRFGTDFYSRIKPE